MTALRAELVRLIQAEGPMPVSRFMALALGHPTLGYYMTRDPLGAAGDFVTSPEVSQMFGEMIGVLMADLYERIGAPARVALVEFGPGRGTLMADLLRVAARVPPFAAALSVHFVETSPVLHAKQREAMIRITADLPALALAPTWHAGLETVPGDLPLLVVANEFFDALPIEQIVADAGRWRERHVGLDARGALVFGMGPPVAVPFPPAPNGTLREISPAIAGLAEAIGARLAAQGGAGVVVDYGHVRSGPGETLQAVRRHRFVDPLEDPGESDLTAHVDFAALAAAARRGGAEVAGPISQRALLERLGIALRASRLMAGARDQTQVRGVEAALARLTGGGEGGMGRLFKALLLHGPGVPVPAAFAEPDSAMDGEGGPQ